VVLRLHKVWAAFDSCALLSQDFAVQVCIATVSLQLETVRRVSNKRDTSTQAAKN
jgi:hypothetical protein